MWKYFLRSVPGHVSQGLHVLADGVARTVDGALDGLVRVLHLLVRMVSHLIFVARPRPSSLGPHSQPPGIAGQNYIQVSTTFETIFQTVKLIYCNLSICQRRFKP